MIEKETATATLAGGCFWCLEAVFELVPGVTKVVSGYCGGDVPNPSYEQVCTGTTGHAESVQLTFDPGIVPLDELLRIFFAVHDPTTKDRQGPDVGPEYRSVIFYHDQDQSAIAAQVIEELQRAKIWPRPVVTEIVPFAKFYPAEEYHQGYYRRNESQPYCQLVITPKVAKFRKEHFPKATTASEREKT